MSQRPACRIDGVVATVANKAVIFRRGPSKLSQLLVWDFETDEVTPGQWLGGRIYTKRCDVSPDGRYLVIAATNYSASHREKNTFPLPDPWMADGWTAISRPPYFTAIALWFSGGAWNGGGIWKSEKDLLLNSFRHGWHEAIEPSPMIKVRPMGLSPSEDEPIFTKRLLSRGWRVARKEVTKVSNPGWQKRAKDFLKSPDFPTALDEVEGWLRNMQEAMPVWRTDVTGILEKEFLRGRLRLETSYTWEKWSVIDDSGTERRVWRPERWHPQWVDVDNRGRVVFGEAGCLWAWADFPDGKAVMVADLNANGFESVAAPDWAKQW